MAESAIRALWRSLTQRSRYTDTRAEAVELQLRADFRDEVIPALEHARNQLEAEGYQVRLETHPLEAELGVMNFNGLELTYRVCGHVYRPASFHLAALDRDTGEGRIPRMEVEWGGRTREYRPCCCYRHRLEAAVLRYYHRFLMDAPTPRS